MTEQLKSHELCKICGSEFAVLSVHLEQKHPGVSLEDYKARYPGAPIMSEAAEKLLKKKIAEKQQQQEAQVKKVEKKEEEAVALNFEGLPTNAYTKVDRNFHEVFELGDAPEARKRQGGDPIVIKVITSAPHADMVPAIDPGYVFNVGELKKMILAITYKMNPYIFGHKGSGKTEFYEQVAARMGMPVLRVQHTANTEESNITGMPVLRDGNVEFQLGPLPLAMMNGWVYLADEYDFAQPSVTSIYQAVLEGKSLVIKDAPPHLRVIKPHPDFKFWANGNTNGSGDESGLYQGTVIQNAANYDRFGVMFYKDYLPRDSEIEILVRRTNIDRGDAGKFIDFARTVRESFGRGEIRDVVSTRALLNAVKVGLGLGNFQAGMELAFTNKLSKTDQMTVSQLAQRYLP